MLDRNFDLAFNAILLVHLLPNLNETLELFNNEIVQSATVIRHIFQTAIIGKLAIGRLLQTH